MKRSWRSHVDNEKGDAANSRVGMGSSGWEDRLCSSLCPKGALEESMRSFNFGDGIGEAVLSNESSSVHFTKEKMLLSYRIFRKEQ